MSPPSPDGDRLATTVDVESAVDAYLETLAANGVEYFFNSPGTEFAPFWEQFAADAVDGIPTSEHGIGYIACRHEELSIHMAIGYTLVTGAPQVVGFHVNVGSLHAAMSIHGAYQGRVPMVLLTSHADTHENELPGGTPGSHYLGFNAPGGFEDYFARYLKWFAHPERPSSVPRYLARAFRIANSAPAGPVLCNLSRELLYDEELDRAEIRREVAAAPSVPSPAAVDDVVEALAAAENPVIVSGMTGRDPDAAAALVELAERLDAPVLEKPKWHHGIPVEHPLSLGDRTFVSRYLGEDVDLVFVVDSSAPWYPPEAGAPGATVILLAPDPAHPKLDYWNYPVDLLLDGDPGATLTVLLSAVDESAEPRPVDWRAEHDALRDAWQAAADAGRDATPIDPFWLCAELDRLLPDDAIVVGETTVHKGVINNLIEARSRTYIGAARVLGGGRGSGLGVALGATLAAPDRPVVALIGDGSLNYNPVSAAFGAAQEHGLPFLTVVFDNRGYASQLGSFQSAYPEGRAERSGRYPGTTILPMPDYARQAEAYDAVGVRLEDPADIPDAVTDGLAALEAGRSALIHAVLEEESPRDRVEPPA